MLIELIHPPQTYTDDMGSEWHYTQNRQPAPAPVTTAQLKQLAEQGLLKPDDLVWQEGMAEWKPAGVVKGLFPPKTSSRDSSVATTTRTTKPDGAAGTGSSATNAGLVQSTKTGSPDTGVSPVLSPTSGLHPLLVLLFTILTLGIFGIFYVWTSNSQRAKGARSTDAAGRPLGTTRHPALVLLLGYLTLGFYTTYWISKAIQECADYLGRPDINSRTELGLMLCLPFYKVFPVLHTLPELVREVRGRAGLTQGTQVSLSLLANPLLFFALPILCMSFQAELNACWSQGS